MGRCTYLYVAGYLYVFFCDFVNLNDQVEKLFNKETESPSLLQFTSSNVAFY